MPPVNGIRFYVENSWLTDFNAVAESENLCFTRVETIIIPGFSAFILLSENISFYIPSVARIILKMIHGYGSIISIDIIRYDSEELNFIADRNSSGKVPDFIYGAENMYISITSAPYS